MPAKQIVSFVYECYQCGMTHTFDNDRSRPTRWLSVGHLDDPEQFCSVACARTWIEAVESDRRLGDERWARICEEERRTSDDAQSFIAGVVAS